MHTFNTIETSKTKLYQHFAANSLCVSGTSLFPICLDSGLTGTEKQSHILVQFCALIFLQKLFQIDDLDRA